MPNIEAETAAAALNTQTQATQRNCNFREQFLGRKPRLLQVNGRERWPKRIGKQAATLLVDGAYLVGNVVTLPAVAIIKGYRSLTHSSSSGGPLEALERRSLPQHLTGVAVYSVALPYDTLKGMVYLLEGGAEGVGVCAMRFSQLLQQMTYRCCDSDQAASVRESEADPPPMIELSVIPPAG